MKDQFVYKKIKTNLRNFDSLLVSYEYEWICLKTGKTGFLTSYHILNNNEKKFNDILEKFKK